MAVPEERAELEHRIEEHTRELKDAIGELREAAVKAADPRDTIRERPFEWLAGGLAIGLWMGWRPVKGVR